GALDRRRCRKAGQAGVDGLASLSLVMPGLVPGIHVDSSRRFSWGFNCLVLKPSLMPLLAGLARP
ncbi:MAG: hypothetical protein WBF40_06830, partial [Methyloceanibacter sp.]